MKKAIIIGASSGIGRALAKVLAENGYELGLVARRKKQLLSLQKELAVKTFICQTDISSPHAIRDVNSLIKEMQGVDLFIINAGIRYKNLELDWKKEQETIEVNVLGFTAMAHVAMQSFLKKEKGHLVGISSVAALRGNGNAPAYGASKAFISNYLEALKHLALKFKKEITVTDIKPGYVDTAMIDRQLAFWVASPELAAQQIYSAIRKKKSHAYITHRWRLMAWLMKITPSFLFAKFV